MCSIPCINTNLIHIVTSRNAFIKTYTTFIVSYSRLSPYLTALEYITFHLATGFLNFKLLTNLERTGIQNL